MKTCEDSQHYGLEFESGGRFFLLFENEDGEPERGGVLDIKRLVTVVL
ncbi:MAG: hypothetical protein GY854_27980 [Deltaproteobacteria bacterium]|nr:hypothetical protein [Deltaproteobacteria bacterium]